MLISRSTKNPTHFKQKIRLTSILLLYPRLKIKIIRVILKSEIKQNSNRKRKVKWELFLTYKNSAYTMVTAYAPAFFSRAVLSDASGAITPRVCRNRLPFPLIKKNAACAVNALRSALRELLKSRK